MRAGPCFPLALRCARLLAPKKQNRNLIGNDFTTLTAGLFDSLKALKALYLGYNELETLPAGLFDSLEALTTL